MVKIKLAKTKGKHKLLFRIIAIDSRKKTNSRALEVIGFFNPKTPTFKINRPRLEHWLKTGAQMTPSVRKLIENEKTA